MTPPLTEPAALAAALGPVERLLVVIDFDGTLAPIVDRPDDAAVDDATLRAVRDLAERTTVAVLSGRPMDDLRRRLPDLPVIYAGGHGAQIRDVSGTILDLIDVTTLTGTLDEAEAQLQQLTGDAIGWLIERKSTSLAVHHRLVPQEDVEERLPRVHALMEQYRADPPGFEVTAGKSVLELRPSDIDKGRALAQIADESPTLMPVVLGDDVTDEDAFRTALDRGGQAVLVASEPRDTLAQSRLSDPRAVVALLELLASHGADS